MGEHNQDALQVRRQLTPIQVMQAVTLLQEGRSQRYVAQQLGITQGAVWKLWTRYRETGLVTRRPGSGRNRKTTAAEDRFLRLQALRNRTVTARDLQADIRQATGCVISDQTVRNRLYEVNLRSRRPVKVPKLQRHHRRMRVQFGRDHLNWQLRHWRRVMFTDESRFFLSGNDGRLRVWRRRGERYLPNTMRETTAYGGGSIMVWGGITLDTRTELVIVRNGALNAQRYINDILHVHVRPYAQNFGQEFVYMHDNARPHVANIVTNYLQDQDIQTMNWPACSPDMNPIEHMWDMLGRAVRTRPNPPQTLAQLEQTLTEEWQRIPQDLIRRLIRSMPRRCQAVIRAGGGNTSY